MQRSYPKRFSKPRIDQHLELIAARLGRAAEDVVLVSELDPGWSELLLIDDASAFPAGVTDDPGRTAGILNARADVVYIDEEFGVVRFGGPIADGRRDGSHVASGETMPPSPLPVLLWRVGIEPGVWIAVSGRPYGDEDTDTVALIRVNDAVLQRGRELSEASERAASRARRPSWMS